jgi:hypothetical protein
MSDPADLAVRRADVADVEAIGGLLHHFNSEFQESTPGPGTLAVRVRQLLATGETAVLLMETSRTGWRFSASARRSGPKGSSYLAELSSCSPLQLERALLRRGIAGGVSHVDHDCRLYRFALFEGTPQSIQYPLGEAQ